MLMYSLGEPKTMHFNVHNERTENLTSYLYLLSDLNVQTIWEKGVLTLLGNKALNECHAQYSEETAVDCSRLY